MRIRLVSQYELEHKLNIDFQLDLVKMDKTVC